MQQSRGLGLVLIKRRTMNGWSCKWCQTSISNLHLYLGAILDKTDVWGAAVWLQLVTPPSSLSLTTDKLRFLLFFHVNANVYDCQRGEAKGCLEVNQTISFAATKEKWLCASKMAFSCEYIIKAPCPTSNTKSPLPLSKKKKKAACTYFSYSLLILTHNDVLRCGIMKLVEQKRKRKRKKKQTATKAKCCVILCLPFKGGALR